MGSFVARPRTAADERVVGLLRQLASRLLSPSEMADALFSLAPDVDGEIANEAIHIAAEATTNDDLRLAEQLWLRLLAQVDQRLITGSSNRAVIDDVSALPPEAPPSGPATPETSDEVTGGIRVRGDRP